MEGELKCNGPEVQEHLAMQSLSTHDISQWFGLLLFYFSSIKLKFNFMCKGWFGNDNNVCISVKGNLFPDTFPPCSQCYPFKKSDILAWLK